jgi:TRAP-type C4-dicarboxylate transport system substrate-binding protein/TRAP-type C4-dicarboxylate transport system permease small subunit
MLRFAIALFMLASAVSAQTIVIRLGTLAPRNSRWHQLILDMGEKWKKASGGRVELKVYPGGEQGDEPEMVQKMRIKSLQGVAISGAGLSGIDAASAALQIPMMYDSWDQLDFVRDRIGPQLEKGLADRGFVVLDWADTGWIHFFSKHPATTPDQFRDMKICVLQGDAASFELFKRNGFQPVSLAATDILTGLQTGLIDTFQAPPMVALGSQWFGGARNMLDIKFAPLTGATLVAKDTWEQIPAVAAAAVAGHRARFGRADSSGDSQAGRQLHRPDADNGAQRCARGPRCGGAVADAHSAETVAGAAGWRDARAPLRPGEALLCRIPGCALGREAAAKGQGARHHAVTPELQSAEAGHRTWFIVAEDSLSVIALSLMMLLPVSEMVTRTLHLPGIPASPMFVQQLTLWVGLLGAALASRTGRLLALSSSTFLPERIRPHVAVFSAFMLAAVSSALASASWTFVQSERHASGMLLPGLPRWWFILIMPVGFGAIALRAIWMAGGWRSRAIALLGLLAPVALGYWIPAGQPQVFWLGIGVMFAAALLGLPIFAVFGGFALLLFWNSCHARGFGPCGDVPAGGVAACCPQFRYSRLAGYFMVQGGATKRLLRVFTALFSWMPGGLALVTVVICAMFTWAGSGLTILSIGGLLVPVLIKTRYPEKFSIGLLTSSGSLGLLFPTSVPTILYCVYSQTPIDQLFIGGMLPSAADGFTGRRAGHSKRPAMRRRARAVLAARSRGRVVGG